MKNFAFCYPRQIFLVILTLLLCVNSVSAEDESRQYSQAEVVGLASLSSFSLVGYTAGLGILSSLQDPPYSHNANDSVLLSLVPGLEPLPMFLSDPGKATIYTGVNSLLYGTYRLSSALSVPSWQQSALWNAYWKFNTESTYEIYRDTRLRSSDPEYRQFRHSSFSEITLAPFNLEALNNPITWALVPVYALASAGGYFGKAPTDSVFVTGRTFLQQQEVSPWIATPVMLGTGAIIAIQNSWEEAYWRGFVYEELKYNFRNVSGNLNWVPASIISSAMFALWHAPLQGGLSWNQATIFVITFAIDGIYEMGGIPAAGAAHGWSNAMGYYLAWLLGGGVSSDLN